jgi:hypothetical protein
MVGLLTGHAFDVRGQVAPGDSEGRSGRGAPWRAGA